MNMYLGALGFSFILMIYSLSRTSFILTHRYNSKKYYSYFFIELLFLVVILINTSNLYIKISYMMIFYIVTTIFMYKNKLREKFFWVSVVYFLMFTVSTFMISLTVILCTINNKITNFVEYNSRNIFLIGFLVLYIILEISLFKFWSKRYLFNTMISKKNNYIFSICIIFILSGSILGIFIDILYILGGGVIGFSHIITIFLSIFAVMLVIATNLNARLQLEVKSNRDIQLSSMQNFLKIANDLDLEKRILYHDLKHHLYAIRYLVQNNNMERVEKYIDKLGVQFINIDDQKFCGNYIVNAICLLKKEICIKNKINYEFNLQVSENLKFDDYELTAVFSNIIDNAIEANYKIGDKRKKFVNLNVKENMNGLIIKMENSSNSSKDINVMKTSKLDKENHGIGIKSMMKIINEHNGNIKFKNKNYIFSMVIYLPY